MWERFPVGRPMTAPLKTWDDHGNPLRRPTWVYKWDVVSEFTGETKKMYLQYTNEFVTLNPKHVIVLNSSFVSSSIHAPYLKCCSMSQVNWEPYGGRDDFGTYHFDLNPKCLEEDHLWLMHCRLICNCVVDYHLPHRVMTQFGLFQNWPPEFKDTNISLHE